MDARDVDAAYAVSRITPGTNLLALYAVLGHRLGAGRWRCKRSSSADWSQRLSRSLWRCSTSTTALWVESLMSGARAGGIAVFLGATVRLVRPQVERRIRLGLSFAVVAFLVAWFVPVSLFVILLAAGLGGALWLRRPA